MNPSRPLRGVFLIFAWFALSVTLLLGTTLLAAWGMTYVRGGGVTDRENLYVGLVAGLIAWLFVAVFHLGKDSTVFTFTHRETFLRSLRAALESMGYVILSQSRTTITTRPGFQSLLFGEGIQIELDENQASCTGPKICLERLRNHFRTAVHIDKVQQSIRESNNRLPERFLKRVELEIRLKHVEQLETLQKHVAELLAPDSDLVIKVHLLATSEAGIREALVEDEIRPWLESNVLGFELHKGHIQRVDGLGKSERRSLMEVTI